jgi:hypothetical protein
VRARGSIALVVVASLLLSAATVVGYTRHAVFNSSQFADRAAATLRDQDVRTVVAEKVTDELILANEPDLLAARPLIASAVAGVVGGGPFRSLFRRAALDAHRALFSHDENTVTLTLVDASTVASAALERLQPKLAAELDEGRRIELLNERIGSASGDLARTARSIRLLAWALAALTLAAAIGAVALSTDRRRTIVQLGAGLAGAGVLIVVVYTVARGVVLASFRDPDARDAAAAVWGTFLGGLLTIAGAMAAAGAVVAAAASSVLRPVALQEPLRDLARRVITEPRRPAYRALRATGLVATGVLLLVYPLVVLQLAARLGGLWLLYLGVDATLRLVYRPPRAPASAPPRRRRHLLGAALIVLALAAITGTALIAGGTDDAPAATPSTCNGHAELCDRPLDDVVIAATHNSMSAPQEGFLSSEQERPIPGQLADGIRGLLFDTYYGDKLENGRVRTELEGNSLIATARDSGVSQADIEAALRLRDRAGFQGEGKRGMFLCHGFCELGATALPGVLDRIHDFLVTHPGEVVVIVNQDYVTPEDFVKAIGDAGLSRYAATDLTQTLRQMIDSDKRLVLLAENHAGAAPWYQLAYDKLVEETPFHFTSAAALTTPAKLPASCRPNRGPENAPFFLINHWVSTDPVPRPSDAAKVNAYAPLLARARECGRIREHLPNLLAINFYKEGDVFRVVDSLNGF